MRFKGLSRLKRPEPLRIALERLREFRNRRALSQARLGELVGVTQTLVSDYEVGRLRLHAGLVMRFAKALPVTADELLGLKESKENGFLNDDVVLGSDGGWVTGVGVDAIWDSRDNVFSPTRGGFSDVRAIFYPIALGGDFEFMEVVADLRWYQTVGGSHVVGIQAYGAAVGGAPPYFRLPKLAGGSRMRGYYEGRYRDRLYLTGQAEYRTHLFWRVGVVVFGGVGSVAPSFNEFDLSTGKGTEGLGEKRYSKKR